MKHTVFTLAIGILIGRYIYINYDREQALKKEARLKQKLFETLEDLGLSRKESKDVVKGYFKN